MHEVPELTLCLYTYQCKSDLYKHISVRAESSSGKVIFNHTTIRNTYHSRILYIFNRIILLTDLRWPSAINSIPDNQLRSIYYINTLILSITGCLRVYLTLALFISRPSLIELIIHASFGLYIRLYPIYNILLKSRCDVA